MLLVLQCSCLMLKMKLEVFGIKASFLKAACLKMFYLIHFEKHTKLTHKLNNDTISICVVLFLWQRKLKWFSCHRSEISSQKWFSVVSVEGMKFFTVLQVKYYKPLTSSLWTLRTDLSPSLTIIYIRLLCIGASYFVKLIWK